MLLVILTNNFDSLLLRHIGVEWTNVEGSYNRSVGKWSVINEVDKVGSVRYTTLVLQRSAVKGSQQNWKCVLLDHCYQKQLVCRRECFHVYLSACKTLVFAGGFGLKKAICRS